MGILGYSLIVALSNDFATLQNGNRIGNIGNHVHVVFDHDDGSTSGHFFDQFRDPLDVLMTHALRGLIEQHDFWVDGQGRYNFQSPLASIR